MHVVFVVLRSIAILLKSQRRLLRKIINSCRLKAEELKRYARIERERAFSEKENLAHIRLLLPRIKKRNPY